MNPDATESAAAVREGLVEALRLDLVGPGPDDARYADEVLPQSPSSFYLTGFLAPRSADPADREGDMDDDPTLEPKGPDDEGRSEATAAKRAFFPSSIGLSVLLPREITMIRAVACWGDYAPLGDEEADVPLLLQPWARTPRREAVDLAVTDGAEVEVPDSGGLRVVLNARPVRGPDGRLTDLMAVAVFLVNRRAPSPDARKDAAFAFQAGLEIKVAGALANRPHEVLRTDDPDEAVAALHYRDAVEYAVGHNVSAEAVVEGDHCVGAKTVWIPRAEVEKVVPRDIEGCTLDMEALARAESAAAVRAMVAPMLAGYAAWIAQARAERFTGDLAGTAADLCNRAEAARDRLEAGLEALEDPDALFAFRAANEAVHTALRQRVKQGAIRWRPFQLAFILLNLRGMVDPGHDDREIVDLLFFPTGGGKTEAYLGLAAFTLVLRRLRHPGVRSAGVSVLMRYTLRLLTYDQLNRAAAMICALERMREADPARLGAWPFEIGLWVGQAATPNRMGARGDRDDYGARIKTLRYLRHGRAKDLPLPLKSCPWCGRDFNPQCFQLLPNTNRPTDLRVRCADRDCHFSGDRSLPIVAVDEPIYRRLPCFVVATVDKFAALPWVGEAGGLFGRVDRHDKDGFYGPCEPNRGRPLGGWLPPPDLVIQDELHLISGPLGTMVGLYEAVIDGLCARDGGGRRVRPKVVASTATVRRAEAQIRALFCRRGAAIFPPPGPDRRDNYFARTATTDEANARLYVGVACQGRSLKVAWLRTLLALMAAAQKRWEAHPPGDANPADPYMTALCYFNALRELGGARRIAEDEVHARLKGYGSRRREGDAEGHFADREIKHQPSELTSRRDAGQIAETRKHLDEACGHNHHVDLALATNMISVGLDVSRLGLMVVSGQPKTASEYIQATSRVGRRDDKPGLVVALLNVHRPRDRSHYERFTAWHDTLYRSVEATSVTPFSKRAVDRAVAEAIVAWVRHSIVEMTPNHGAIRAKDLRPRMAEAAEVLARRAGEHSLALSQQELRQLTDELRARAEKILDEWNRLAHRQHEVGAGLAYYRGAGGAKDLLHRPTDPAARLLGPDWQTFRAHRSLRDVEATASLWLRQPDGFEAAEEAS